MSAHSPSSTFTVRHPAHGAVAHASARPKLLAAIALLVAVLMADALLIRAVAPSLAELSTFYVTTT